MERIFFKKNLKRFSAERLLKQKGFTLFEILVALSLFVVIILIVGSIFILAQKSYSKGAGEAELTQNIRVSLDRISRELRQTTNIATSLPATNSDPLNPPTEEIFFQDGHDISQITYIRYYLDGTNLMRKQLAYYFAPQTTLYVPYNSVDQYSDPPQEYIIENPTIISEYFNKLNFWGSNGLIHIFIELEKNQNKLNIDSAIYGRN
jgi:prepilin-type N-terminal cleavage/methylation domain-containing protein